MLSIWRLTWSLQTCQTAALMVWGALEERMLSSKKTLQNNVSTPAKPGFRVLSQLLVSEWKVQQIIFWFKLNELSSADIQIIRRRLESEVSADASRRIGSVHCSRCAPLKSPRVVKFGQAKDSQKWPSNLPANRTYVPFHPKREERQQTKYKGSQLGTARFRGSAND